MKHLLLAALLPIAGWAQQKPKLTTHHGFRATAFAMTTQNGVFGPHSNLQDYQALTSGLEYLGKFELGKWRLNLDLYGTALVAGNPFEKDSLTGKTSRYESGLLAVDRPERSWVAVPSIVELSYTTNKAQWSVGSFSLDGTFLNEEHGRMIPSTFAGTKVQVQLAPTVLLKSALITHVAARSTSGFKTVANSLAQYNPGLDTSGSVHNKSEVQTPFIGYAELEVGHRWNNWTGLLSIESYTLPNVFGTLVVDEVLKRGVHALELQFVAQYLLGNGGNEDPTLAYFQQERSRYFAAEYTHKVGEVNYFVGLSHITDEGKLLFPREWGREYLVTFQGRERQEGMGGSSAVVAGARSKWQEGKVKHSGGVSTGVYMRPEPTNYALNKYAMPSNQQTNLWWRQQWGGRNEFTSLFVLKVPLSSAALTAGQTINKVDMIHFSFIYRYTILPGHSSKKAVLP